MELVERFKPLLKKYAYHLHYEDSFEDLRMEFLQALKNIKLEYFQTRHDCVFICYIQKVIYHAYLKRLNHTNTSFILYSALSDAQKHHIDHETSLQDCYNDLLSSDLKRILSQKEYQVIVQHVIHGYSISTIAKATYTSRQAINQTKLSALRKIGHAWKIV